MAKRIFRIKIIIILRVIESFVIDYDKLEINSFLDAIMQLNLVIKFNIMVKK